MGAISEMQERAKVALREQAGDDPALRHLADLVEMMMADDLELTAAVAVKKLGDAYKHMEDEARKEYEKARDKKCVVFGDERARQIVREFYLGGGASEGEPEAATPAPEKPPTPKKDEKIISLFDMM